MLNAQTRTRLIAVEPLLLRVMDLTLGTVPTAVVWPPLPAPIGAKSLTSIAAGTTDGRFYVADRGASVVWSLAVPLQVSAAILARAAR